RAAEIGKVDQRQQQTGNPEDVLVREQGNEAQHGDDLELQLVAPVRDALGQGVQSEEQDTDAQNGAEENHGHDHHEHVGLAGGGDERRQMVGCYRVNGGVSHTAPPVEDTRPPDLNVADARDMLLAKFLLQTLGRFRTRNQSVEAAALVVVNLLEKMV